MKLKHFTLVFLLLFVIKTIAQDAQKDVLFTVDSEPVYASEFLRVYNKNLDLVQDEAQKGIDEYLRLFVNYKVKLKEAKVQGLHQKESYKRELSTYKKQLAKNYMSDNTVSEALVKEAYEHISHDIKANHILVKVSENARPSDSLAAYNQIMKLRDRALAESFEIVRKEVHDGKKLFGEALGWFTGFRMVYKFEKVAFQTPVGEISQPFRTRFGYHIVKVFDKRESRGERTVRHIMVVDKKDTTNAAETRIKEIYKKVQQGEAFEALAMQFSDDKNSAPRGGLLNAFASGQLSSPEFEEAAFALKNKGDISEPVKTKFGWHIIKLEEADPIGSFEKLKPELEAKVKRDDRSKLIEEALIDKLKHKYNATETPSLDYFASILNDDFYKRQWKLPESFKAETPLVKIGQKQFTYADFGEFLMAYQKKIRVKKTFGQLIENAYRTFFNTSIKQYAEENLEAENEDFAHILNEYRDGLLLFDLMETNIWQTAKTDSLEIQKFYEARKAEYFWPIRAEADVASSAKRKVINRVTKLLEKNMSIEAIKKLVNTNGNVDVIFTSGIMDAKHQALPNDFDFKQGISKVYKHNGGYVVAKVKQVLPKKLKTFEEVKGLAMSDYQTHKEALWLNELKEKYKVVVNKDVLKKVKAEI